MPLQSLELQGMSEKSFSFRVISKPIEQPRELVQAIRLSGVVICKGFDFRSQHDLPRFVPVEVLYEVTTNIPDIARVLVHGCEHIKQVFDIHILGRNPSCLFEPGPSRVDFDS